MYAAKMAWWEFFVLIAGLTGKLAPLILPFSALLAGLVSGALVDPVAMTNVEAVRDVRGACCGRCSSCDRRSGGERRGGEGHGRGRKGRGGEGEGRGRGGEGEAEVEESREYQCVVCVCLSVLTVPGCPDYVHVLLQVLDDLCQDAVLFVNVLQDLYVVVDVAPQWVGHVKVGVTHRQHTPYKHTQTHTHTSG